jgi:endonuclease/exonuclease/phosphatase family metal-dependent hydrolase
MAILFSNCQEPPALSNAEAGTDQICRIMFWNSENLFDCFNDTTKLDDEFLPHGLRGWNTTRYNQKINNMYKVFIAAGDWDPPDLIGLCEIENRNVLFDLVRNSEFSFYNYKFIHHDSPDRRGIDVALLYNPKTVEIITEMAITVDLSDDDGSATRDILYSRIKIETDDTLSIFVTHWPSKYGGAGVTAGLREKVAEILAENILKIRQKYSSERIIVMGDFNDPPESNSLEALCIGSKSSGLNENPLMVNLGKGYNGKIPGSYKFEGAWQLIDQVLVSENLISGIEGPCVRTGSFRVFSPAFLLENDEKYGGQKPFRTYAGMVYQGGFSDHLPVLVDLFSRR